jgi:hypothetical protein
LTYDPQQISGSIHNFPYVEIQARVPEEVLRRYARDLRKRYDKLAKRWDARRNAEWMIRSYLAGRRMVTATVTLTSTRTKRRGRREEEVARFHAGLMDALHATAMLLPEQRWDAVSHLAPDALVKIAVGSVAEVYRNQSEWIAQVLGNVREFHQMATTPGEWVGQPPRVRARDVYAAARYLCELTQWRSEVLADSLARHAEPPIGWDFSLLLAAASPDADGTAVLDEHDVRRVGALMGSAPHPDNLWILMRDHLGDEIASLWKESGAENVALDGWLIYPLR